MSWHVLAIFDSVQTLDRVKDGESKRALPR